MLFAEENLPVVSPHDLGAWLIVFLAVLSGVWLARQLWVSFFPIRSEREAFVTQAQLDRMDATLTMKFADHETRMKAELAAVKDDVKEQVDQIKEEQKEQGRYMHESTHKLNNSVQALVSQIAAIGERSKLQSEMLADLKVKADGQIEKGARMMTLLERSCPLMEKGIMEKPKEPAK